MLIATTLPRIFSFRDKEQDIQLADPSPSFSPEAVLNFYAQTYPHFNHSYHRRSCDK